MNEVKLFKVIGRIKKPNFNTNFQKEVYALKPEDAIEKVYKTLGSKHKAKRFYIIIENVKAIDEEQQ
jgi:ribosomal protein L20A (L18A)